LIKSRASKENVQLSKAGRKDGKSRRNEDGTRQSLV